MSMSICLWNLKFTVQLLGMSNIIVEKESQLLKTKYQDGDGRLQRKKYEKWKYLKRVHC